MVRIGTRSPAEVDAGEENSNESKDRTSTTTTTIDAHRDDGSIEAEVQQLHWEHRCIAQKVKTATRDKDFGAYDEDDQNREREREREYGTKVWCAAEVQ